MERRDTWLSRGLQGTEVTTENCVAVSARRALTNTNILTLASGVARVYLYVCSGSLDFTRRADRVESRAINKRPAISGSVIYPPEATPTNPRKTSRFIPHQAAAAFCLYRFIALCLLHTIAYALPSIFHVFGRNALVHSFAINSRGPRAARASI